MGSSNPQQSIAHTLVVREQLGISDAATAITGALTWLGRVDARCADHLWEGGANRDLDGALLSGREVLCGGLLVVLWHWLVVLWRRGQWSLDGRRLNVLTGQDKRTSDTPSLQSSERNQAVYTNNLNYRSDIAFSFTNTRGFLTPGSNINVPPADINLVFYSC